LSSPRHPCPRGKVYESGGEGGFGIPLEKKKGDDLERELLPETRRSYHKVAVSFMWRRSIFEFIYRCFWGNEPEGEKSPSSELGGAERCGR